MTVRAAWLAAALLALVAPTSRAGNCTGQPLCGSLVVARAGSGNSTLVEEEIEALANLANQALGPAETERLADPIEPSGEGNISHEIAEARVAVDEGVFAIAAGTTSDAHDFGKNVYAVSSGRIFYDEELSVASQTVPAGTPVVLRLRYRVAFGTNLVHTAASYSYTGQYTDVQTRVLGSLDNHVGGSDFDESLWFVFLGLSSNISGLFTTSNPVETLEVPVNVGQDVRIQLRVENSAGSQASIMGDSFPIAASAGTVAVVFGVEVDTPGVVAESNLLGGPLPDFSNVTQGNAIANALPISIGGPVTVPEPAPALLTVGVLFAIGAIRYACSNASA